MDHRGTLLRSQLHAPDPGEIDAEVDARHSSEAVSSSTGGAWPLPGPRDQLRRGEQPLDLIEHGALDVGGR